MPGKNLPKFLIPAALAASLVACAPPRAQYTPYPSTDKSAQQYHRDVAECQNWAASQMGASQNRQYEEGARGAVTIGLLGAVLGALAGDAKVGGLAGASIGAVGGGMKGSQDAQTVYNMAYQDCLRKKGY